LVAEAGCAISIPRHLRETEARVEKEESRRQIINEQPVSHQLTLRFQVGARNKVGDGMKLTVTLFKGEQ
jgi:hypothetical protein